MCSSTASARTVSCVPQLYGPISQSLFPTVFSIRAIGLPKRFGPHASRCLAAETIGADIQQAWRQHNRFPHIIHLHGYLWNAGIWHIGYQTRHPPQADPYEEATATHGRETVMLGLGA